MAENQPSEPRVDFPGLDLVYERAIASYQEIGARFDAANQRIDGLLTLTSTVAPAAPTHRRRDRHGRHAAVSSPGPLWRDSSPQCSSSVSPRAGWSAA